MCIFNRVIIHSRKTYFTRKCDRWNLPTLYDILTLTRHLHKNDRIQRSRTQCLLIVTTGSLHWTSIIFFPFSFLLLFRTKYTFSKAFPNSYRFTLWQPCSTHLDHNWHALYALNLVFISCIPLFLNRARVRRSLIVRNIKIKLHDWGYTVGHQSYMKLEGRWPWIPRELQQFVDNFITLNYAYISTSQILLRRSWQGQWNKYII